tara:strand:+ start:210 stop:407 length:198 start_codon:yes stop_codon:yes gene_type:complete
MRNAFAVKDVVVMKENRKERGIIVGVIRGGKYKILWDRDWHTGRTRVHPSKDIIHISMLEGREAQ